MWVWVAVFGFWWFRCDVFGFDLMVCLRFLCVLIAYAGGCCGFGLDFVGWWFVLIWLVVLACWFGVWLCCLVLRVCLGLVVLDLRRILLILVATLGDCGFTLIRVLGLLMVVLLVVFLFVVRV